MAEKYQLNHRKRMREKYEKIGFENLTDLERVEMIFYLSNSRKDTKPLAHKCIEKFGSLVNLFNASQQQLEDAGVPPASRFVIGYLADCFDYIQKEEASKKQYDYDSLGKYFVKRMGKLSTENLGIVVLDCDNKVLRETMIDGGTLEEIALNKRKLVELSLGNKSSKVAIAHNHPSGHADASFADHNVTKKLDELFSSISITLVEHFVIAKNIYKGIIGDKARMLIKKIKKPSKKDK